LHLVGSLLVLNYDARNYDLKIQSAVLTLNIKPTAYSETSVANCHCTLRKVGEERRSHVHRCVNLQTRTKALSYIDRLFKIRIYLPAMEFITPLVKLDCPPMVSRLPRALVCADVQTVFIIILGTKSLFYKCKKIKWSLYRPGVAQRVGRVIALLFHDRGTRRGLVVSSTPRPHFTPRKDPVPILQEAGWAPGPVWTGGESVPTRIRSRTVQPGSSVAIPTELPSLQILILWLP
jgi:hypothetical protein